MIRTRIHFSRLSFESFPHAASFAAVAVGAFVLLGWFLDIAALKSVFPEMATMKMNTAIAFILCGAALWPKQSHSLKPVGTKVFANLCAGTVLLIGILTIAEYLFGYSFGLDEWLIEDQATHSAETVEFDAVVLNLLTTEIDGFEFLDRFRGVDNCRHTPVIVWTGKALTPEDLTRLKNAAQAVALKRRGGIDHMLEELARHASPVNRDREAIQSVATTLSSGF